MNYLDIIFPEELGNFFYGGLEFSTSIATTKNRQEIRNSNRNEAILKYKLLYKTCSIFTYEKLKSFFLICKGCQNSFNFLDKNDCYVNRQIIGIANGENSTFQIFKQYSYGDKYVNKNLYKITDEEVFINGNIVSNNNFCIKNGMLIFNNTNLLKNGDIISISCKFYIIVRFCNDYLPIINKTTTTIELPDISLIEVPL